jgi:hypothetical protein
MNQLESETNGAMAAAEPLFASVWLALFYELRKHYLERRLMRNASPRDSHPRKKN